MLCWQPARPTGPDVPAHRDNNRCHTHADSNGHAKSYGHWHAESDCDDDAKPHRNGNGHAQSHGHADGECNRNPNSDGLYIV